MSKLSSSILLLLIAGMLSTGTVNTLLSKLQDMACVANCDAEDPSERKTFSQPLYQTVNMFMGEAMCLAVFFLVEHYVKRTKSKTSEDLAETEPLLAPEASIAGSNHDHFAAIHADDPLSITEDTTDHHHNFSNNTSANNTPLTGNSEEEEENSALTSPELIKMEGKLHLLLFLPTLCDLSATTLMNIGLISISASIYQMLRGSVVLFTGVFSFLFLNRRHPLYRWIGLLTVFVGVAIVGLSGVDNKENEEDNETIGQEVFGVLCVVLAQVFTATQFVIEEKILVKYDIPALKAVGLEGFFGLVSFAIAGPILYFTIGKGTGSYFDLVQGAKEFAASNIVIWTGLAVTRNISATSRSTIDTCRTLFIWLISLGLGWETFSFLQVVGFMVLLTGTFLFNDIFGTFDQ